MKMKTIYAVLLTTAVCAGTGVFAQTAEDSPEKYYTLERIRSKSGWLAGDNAAGLIFNQVSLSTADVTYDFSKGDYRNVTDGSRTHGVGVQSESYRRWDRLSFYGKLGYSYNTAADQSWRGNTDFYTSPMSVGDSIPGNTRNEIYSLKAGVAYQVGRFVFGAMAEYENQSLAKRRDSRNKTTYMHLGIRPGVVFTSKAVNAGLNFIYERTTESVEYNSFGTNTTAGTVYLYEGLWFYSTEQLSAGTLNPIYYKGSKLGGAAQLEFRLGQHVRFFNQFSAAYDEMERYRKDLNQHLGDNDRLTYRYLGVLNITGRRVDQRLSADASFGDLMKYNNIQELIIDPSTNQQMYRQLGKFLKFTQKQRRVDAAYKLFVKRNAWSSSWIIDLEYEYFKNESKYTINPASFNQDIHYSRLQAGVTKNFLFGSRDWLDVTLKGGYAFGGGTELEKSVPEGVTIENENYRHDLLAQEYAFLTNDRLHAEAGMRYTHFFPAKKIGMYVDLRGGGDWARSGLFDGCSRGRFTAAVGLNF